MLRTISLLSRSAFLGKSTFSYSLLPPIPKFPSIPLTQFSTNAHLISYELASQSPTISLMEKLSNFKFMNMYHTLDEYSRQLLFTLCNDVGLGMSLSIIAISFGIKLLFLYPTVKTQLQGLRQKQIKKMQERMQQKMKVAQMTKNMALRKQAQYDFKMQMRKKGFGYGLTMLNMLQMPILITWFLSLRFVSSLPQVYPQMLSQGILWFHDLSVYDPYFLLPVLAAIASSLSILYSPTLSNPNMTAPFMAPFIKYLKFAPFASLVFTGFFPASISLYWLILSLSQLLCVQIVNAKSLRKYLEHNRPIFKTEEKPVYVNIEKVASGVIMEAAKIQSELKSQKSEETIKESSKIHSSVKVEAEKLQKEEVTNQKPKIALKTEKPSLSSNKIGITQHKKSKKQLKQQQTAKQ